MADTTTRKKASKKAAVTTGPLVPVGTPTGPVVVTVENDHDPADDLIPFNLQDKDGNLDPYLYTATRPKMAVLLRVMAAMGMAETEPMQAAVQMENLLDRIVTPESAQALRKRMLDPDDYLDLPHLGPIVEPFVGRWYGGPTRSPSGSSRKRPRSGTSSTGRRRSPAST